MRRCSSKTCQLLTSIKYVIVFASLTLYDVATAVSSVRRRSIFVFNSERKPPLLPSQTDRRDDLKLQGREGGIQIPELGKTKTYIVLPPKKGKSHNRT